MISFNFRSSEFLNQLVTWQTNGRGLVVATCVNSVFYDNFKQTNNFLSEYGLVYITPGWSGSATINPLINSFTWAHLGKGVVIIYSLNRK